MSQLLSFINETDNLENKDLLGGKGAGLKTISKLGIPVPNAFILTTNCWRQHNKSGLISIKETISGGLNKLENLSNKKLGDKTNPLIISVRSGAKFSMPGMMETILNIGVNAETIHYFESPEIALKMYSRMLKMFAKAVFEIDIEDKLNKYISNSRDIKQIAQDLNKIYFDSVGKEVPQDPREQIYLAVDAVFKSWFAPSANAYRQLYGIPDELGTAAVLQEMVFGNLENSGTGIFFTRNIDTGDSKPTGNFLTNAQGEEIVDGKNISKAVDIEEFSIRFPKFYNELMQHGSTLENHYKDVQDIEFTIEKNKLFLLQTRNAKRTPYANVRLVTNLLSEGVLNETEAISKVNISDVKNIYSKSIVATPESKIVCKGETACLGSVVGKVVADINNVELSNENIILITDYVDPNNINLLKNISGVITTKGNPSSHMGLVFKALNLPSIVGCGDLILKVKDGDYISLDASKGEAYLGKLDITQNSIGEDLEKFLNIWKSKKGYSAWASTFYDEQNTPNIDNLVTKINESYEKSGKVFKSQKAKVISVLNEVFDEKVFIKNKLFKPTDIEGIKKALADVINSGYSNSARTCHFPEKLAGAPWGDGPNTIEEIDEFMSNPEYKGKYGGLPKWVEDPTLDAVMVCWEPQGKMDFALTEEHFAVTVSLVEKIPLTGLITIHFGSPHLRKLEDVSSDDIVRIKFVIDEKFEFNLGNPDYEFGKNYYSEEGISNAYDDYKKNESSVQELIREYTGQVNNDLTLEEFKEILNKLIIRKGLYDDFYRGLIKDGIYAICTQVFEKVSELWKPPYFLPFTIAALDKALGLSILEMQGRHQEDKLIWFKIYGAKGSEEKDKVAKASTETS